MQYGARSVSKTYSQTLCEMHNYMRICVLFIAPPCPDGGSPEPQVLAASLREEEGQGRVSKYTNPL